MRRAVCFIIAFLFSTQAFAASLPDPVKEALEAAHATGNAFVIHAVTQEAIKQNPKNSQTIQSHIDTLNAQQAQATQQENLAALAPAAGDNNKTKPWKGSLEGGLNVETGNTEKENIKLASMLEYISDKWENTLKLKADSAKEKDTRISEEYRAQNQTRYRLTERDYVFGELEYVNDRFSGYDYRVSELLGYGRDIFKSDRFTLTGEASLGARQSSLSDGTEENSLLGKLGGKAEWKITDNLTFSEELTTSIASDATITESLTALKSNLTDSLYLKLGVDVEHISDVPPGKENTDTKTSLTVGYEF